MIVMGEVARKANAARIASRRTGVYFNSSGE